MEKILIKEIRTRLSIVVAYGADNDVQRGNKN